MLQAAIKAMILHYPLVCVVIYMENGAYYYHSYFKSILHLFSPGRMAIGAVCSIVLIRQQERQWDKK